MSHRDTISRTSRMPALTERRAQPRAGSASCQGWLCNYLRDSYSSAPGPGPRGPSALGSLGGCPIHSWY